MDLMTIYQGVTSRALISLQKNTAKAGKIVELVGVAFSTGMEVARQLEKSEV